MSEASVVGLSYSVMASGHHPADRPFGRPGATKAPVCMPRDLRERCGHTWGAIVVTAGIAIQTKNPQHSVLGVICLKPGDVLLSHGETPHYHRRRSVSRLSSGWGQVVPLLYGRQANWYGSALVLHLN